MVGDLVTHAITTAHEKRLRSERNSKRSMRPTHGHVLTVRLKMTEPSENRRLVYGVVNDNLILLPEDVAKAYVHDHEAIWALGTCGDARRFEPLGINPPPGLEEHDDVGADAPYDASVTNEFEDGTWPPSAATIALDALPEDLADVGEELDRFPGSPILYIDPATEEDLVETLRLRDYVVRRDDELIGRI